jgi:hypothetical protein
MSGQHGPPNDGPPDDFMRGADGYHRHMAWQASERATIADVTSVVATFHWVMVGQDAVAGPFGTIAEAAGVARDVDGSWIQSGATSCPLVACAVCGEELHPDEASKDRLGRPLCSGCAFDGLANDLRGESG